MSSESRFSRAAALMSQSRFELAEVEMRKELVENPDDPTVHALLAICLAESERYNDATEEAKLAIHLGPDDSFSFYAMARVHVERERWREAEQALREAIQLDSNDEENFSLLAAVLLNRERWQAALDAAEQGLEIDPEHTDCINIRAIALRRMGRDDSAGESIQEAMRQDPEDALTHCNMGWWHLEQGDRDKAVEHFRESLRLDPELQSAREGMLDVLRSKNVVYRTLLQFLFWLGKQSTKVQWTLVAVAIGVYIAMDKISDAHPDLGVWLRPLSYLFMGCVWLTWIGEPLFDLVLRFSRDGRHFLSEREISRANWCAVFIVPGIICLALAAILGYSVLFLCATMLAMLMLPVMEVFDCHNPWVRKRMIAFTIIVVSVGLANLVCWLWIPLLGDDLRTLLRPSLMPVFLISLLASLFADEFANWLKQRAPGR